MPERVQMAQALSLGGVLFEVYALHITELKKKKHVKILSPLLPTSTHQESLKEKATET